MNDQVNSTDTNWNWNEYSSTFTEPIMAGFSRILKERCGTGVCCPKIMRKEKINDGERRNKH